MAFNWQNLHPSHVLSWLHDNAPHLVEPLLSHIANNPVSNALYNAAGSQGQIDANSPEFIQHQNSQLGNRFHQVQLGQQFQQQHQFQPPVSTQTQPNLFR